MELRLPGPTMLPPDVIAVLSNPDKWLINHRGPEFGVLLETLTDNMKQIFQTQNDIFFVTGSGTTGMESAVLNLCGVGRHSRGSVFILENGFFGRKFVEIATGFSIEPNVISFPLDQPIRGAELYEKMVWSGNAGLLDVVYFVHNESSTGITNDAESIIETVRKFNPGVLVAVDAISSMGGINIPTDQWGIDLMITASQKALMAPAGMAIVSTSKQAAERIFSLKNRGYSSDLQNYNDYSKKKQTPFTPSVATLAALSVSTKMILREGLQNVYVRHERIAKYIKRSLTELGFQVIGDSTSSSLTVTAAYLPEDVKSKCGNKKLVALLKEREGLEIAAGIHEIGGRMGEVVRIGHMGYILDGDAERIIDKIKRILEYLRKP